NDASHAWFAASPPPDPPLDEELLHAATACASPASAAARIVVRSGRRAAPKAGEVVMPPSLPVRFLRGAALLEIASRRREEIGLDEGIEIAVEDGVHVRVLVRGARVLHQPVRLEDVIPNLAAEVDCALRSLICRVLVLAPLELHFEELRLQDLHRHRAVLV